MTDFQRLEPCGEANPAPTLVLQAQVLRKKEVKGGHLKLELQSTTGERLGAFGPNMGALSESLPKALTLFGSLKADLWRGGDAVELILTREPVGQSC